MGNLAGFWPFPFDSELSNLSRIISLAAASVGVWLWWYRWAQRGILGPKGWPLIGSLLEANANWDNIHEYATGYLQKSQAVRLSLGFGMEIVFTADPRSVEHISKTNFSNFSKGPMIKAAHQEFFGQGIFLADGESWKHQRKIAGIELASSKLRVASTEVFRDYALRLTSILLEKARSPQSQIDFQDLAGRMTLDSTVKLSFGVELGCLSPSLPERPVATSFDTACFCAHLRFVDPLWRVKRFLQVGREKQLKHAIDVLDKFAYGIIQKRKGELSNGCKGTEEKYDLLSRFIMPSMQEDVQLNDKALRDFMISYILAGRDTTSSALTWLFYMLYLHPEVTAKIRAELSALESRHYSSLGKASNQTEEEELRAFSELLTFENVASLTYLHATVTESMRLYPPVPMNAKHVEKDDILPDGTKVKKGSTVAFNAYAMGRMEYLWGPDAAEFKPERWLKDGVFQPESPFKYIVFYSGPRKCLGKDSAYLQTKMTTAFVCRFFNLQLVPGHDVSYRTSLELSMVHGLQVSVRMRNFS